MSIKVSCDGCGKSYQVDDRFAGKKAKCKACGHGMQVPGARAVASASASPTKPSSKSSTKPSRKPVETDDSAGEFDLSALADVERTGAIDHTYQPPAMNTAPSEGKKNAGSKGTTYAAAKARTATPGKTKVIEAPKTFAEAMIPGVMGYLFIGLILVGMISFVHEKVAGIVALVIGAIGVLLCVSAKLQTLSMAREEGTSTYLLYRFVPFYSFYFVCTRWYDAQSSVLSWMKGTTLTLLAAVLLLRAGGIDKVLGRKDSGSDNAPMKSKRLAKVEDPKADDEDANEAPFPEDSTLAQRIAIRRARRMQADKDAVGGHDVEKDPRPVRTESPELGEPSVGSMTTYSHSLAGEFQGEPAGITLFVPNGTHPDHSLACVLMTADRDDPLEGRTVTEAESNAAGVFVSKGFAVLLYDTSRWALNTRPQSVTSCVSEFMMTEGGMQQARTALNFLADRAVMVDMNRVYAVGLRGSATIALNLAAMDPRIRAVATYLPVCDVSQGISEPILDVGKRLKLNGIEEFVKRISPINHVSELKCRVLVLTSGEGGDVAPPPNRDGGISAFTAAMQAAGKPITVTAAIGEKTKRYELDVVLPQMFEWLKSLPPSPAPTRGRGR